MRAAVLLSLLLASPLSAQAPGSSELSSLLGSGSEAGFEQAIAPRAFSFPADHGPHPGFRNEWWYFTGNLETASGRRFGYELTIFRFSLAPEPVAEDSAWRTRQVYIAHFAVTDVDGEQFLSAEKFSRGALGLAGAQGKPFRVFIDDWEIAEAGDGTWTLSADDRDLSVSLTLEPMKGPVLNGDNGLSQKSAEPGNASYYYSMPRWASRGEIRIGTQRFDVTGLSWLDREWSTSALAADQVGWDWFALQLDDGSDLMFYQLRQADGTPSDESSGTLIAADGTGTPLPRDDVRLRVTGRWESPAGGTYPSGWQLQVPSRNLTLEITPVLEDQELFTTVRYWEGAVDVTGQRDGAPVTGRGYVELTGYAESVE